MGCNPCENVESEPQFDFDGTNNKIQSKKTNQSYYNFQNLFEENLPKLGEKCSENEFNSVIPMEIKNYMSQHPLKKDSKYDKIPHTYGAEPIQFNNGNIYKGNWNNDLKMDGPGIYYLKEDKILAQGNWDNGECKFARVFQPNGDIYEGELKDSKFNGKGKLISANEEVYEGDFVDGEKTGYGKITFPDQAVYEGYLEKGELKGKGKMTWINGYEYTGEFDRSALNGKGKLLKNNGDVYEGDFLNNLFHGNGKYTFNRSGNEYDGEFQYGMKKGKGTFTAKDEYIYTGNWDNDLPCGIGKFTNLKNNAILKSTWRFGKMVEEPIYEKGNEDDFNSIDLSIKPEEMNLNTKELSNLEKVDNDCTQYKIGDFPSFLSNQ